ncbi:3956_t:CDS:2, partial [Racocetra fulgida]
WTMILDKETEKLNINNVDMGAGEDLAKIILDEGFENLHDAHEGFKSMLRQVEIFEIHQDKQAKELNYEELKIKNEFLEADGIIFSQLKTLQRHPNASQLESDENIFSQCETPQRDSYECQLILTGNAS